MRLFRATPGGGLRHHDIIRKDVSTRQWLVCRMGDWHALGDVNYRVWPLYESMGWSLPPDMAWQECVLRAAKCGGPMALAQTTAVRVLHFSCTLIPSPSCIGLRVCSVAYTDANSNDSHVSAPSPPLTFIAISSAGLTAATPQHVHILRVRRASGSHRAGPRKGRCRPGLDRHGYSHGTLRRRTRYVLL